MNEIGLKANPEFVVEGDHTIEGGVELFGNILASGSRPTAVLCSNDLTAIGVMRRAYEEGIRIPKDLSVVGFDDIRLAQFVLPALTTVQMSQAELARIAFQALLTEVQRETPSATGTEYVLKTDLVLRESTGMVSANIRRSIGRNGSPNMSKRPPLQN
jgi:LacI family transcriptional regulator